MIALIDADILPYEFGGMVQLEEPEKPLEWDIVRSMVDDRINQIVEATSSERPRLFLTDSGSNFRLKAATILPYKGQRKQEKPYHWERIRQHLIDCWDAEVQYGIEADDQLGIVQMSYIDRGLSDYSWDDGKDGTYNQTVICSRDKDLHMIPGWHYQWECGKQKEKLWFQDETSAIRCFYKQLLTGDNTDNILGLFGVGASSTLLKTIDQLESEEAMYLHVKEQYEKRFGSYWWQFMLENAKLLWILRKEPVSDEFLDAGQEIYLRLDNLYIDLFEDS